MVHQDHWPFDFSGGKKVLGWASHIVWLIRNPFKSVESYYHYLYSGYRHSVTQEIDSMCLPIVFVVTFLLTILVFSLSLISLSLSFLVPLFFPSTRTKVAFLGWEGVSSMVRLADQVATNRKGRAGTHPSGILRELREESRWRGQTYPRVHSLRHQRGEDSMRREHELQGEL